MQKLISFEIKADFGMLKKPDTNEPVYLTFNMLHKPALLGILGAIAGMKGFSRNGELPEYYQQLKSVKVGIKPLLKEDNSGRPYHENGNYTKTIIQYNNGTGMASEEAGGNLIIAEQTLITPAFRCFVLLDDVLDEQKKLMENLLSYKAEYIPYFGKNECSVWWENAEEVQYYEFKPEDVFKINSLFIKELPVKRIKVNEPLFDLSMDSPDGCTFCYFENLPVAYLGAPLFQYEYRNFAYTDWNLSIKKDKTGFLIQLQTDKNEIIQLF